jgi:hypothetical protein
MKITLCIFYEAHDMASLWWSFFVGMDLPAGQELEQKNIRESYSASSLQTKSSRENLQRKKAGGDNKVVAETLARGKHKQERS